MPFNEATLAVLASRIELKRTMSNALGETEHIRSAKGCAPRNEGTLQPDTEHIHDAQACRNAIAAVTGTARVGASHPREGSHTLSLSAANRRHWPTSIGAMPRRIPLR